MGLVSGRAHLLPLSTEHRVEIMCHGCQWLQETSLQQCVSPAVAQEGCKNARTASPRGSGRPGVEIAWYLDPTMTYMAVPMEDLRGHLDLVAGVSGSKSGWPSVTASLCVIPGTIEASQGCRFQTMLDSVL